MYKYWVILKKVSFGIFDDLGFQERKKITVKSKDEVLSLSKFS